MIQTVLASLLLLLPLQMPDVQAQVAEITETAKTSANEVSESPKLVVPPPPSPEPPPPAPKPVQATTAPQTPAGGVLACIRRYESRGNYRAVSPSGKYKGAYQFDLPTWRSVGGSGDPSRASVAEQDKRASILLSRRGLSPWPTPNRRCR